MNGTGSSGSITGRVTTDDGWPVQHASVTAITTTGEQAGVATTGTSGTFTVSDLLPGTHTVIVSAAGYEPHAQTVRTRQADEHLPVTTLRRAAADTLPAPGTWLIDPVHSTVTASIKHLGLNTIRGRLRDFSGEIAVAEPIEASSVHARLNPASVDTDNADRDKHLRSPDFLDTARFPSIEFKSNQLARRGDSGWALEGSLMMKGETRPITLTMTYHGTSPDPWGGTRAGFTAATELARDDFAMNWNMAILPGIGAVGRTLRIDLDIQAVHQQ